MMPERSSFLSVEVKPWAPDWARKGMELRVVHLIYFTFWLAYILSYYNVELREVKKKK